MWLVGGSWHAEVKLSEASRERGTGRRMEDMEGKSQLEYGTDAAFRKGCKVDEAVGVPSGAVKLHREVVIR